MWGANTANKFLRLPNADIWKYNAWDCHATAHLHLALQRELADPKVGNAAFYDRWVQPLMLSVLKMQKRGILVDREARAALKKRYRAELTEVDSLIRAHADSVGFKYTDKFPNSDQQVGKLLFDTCGLKPAGRTEKGRPKVDQGAIVRILRDLRKKDQPHRDLLLNLNHRSRIQTIWERYLDFEVSGDSRVRARVKLCGTKTFRYSMADPALHQFPTEVRGFFIPRPGHLFLNLDYSAIEARILAILSGDEISLRIFKEGGDVHVQNAMDAWGFTPDLYHQLDPPIQKAYRYESKTRLYRICLHGDTKLATLGPERSQTIREIRPGTWVWSWGERGYIPTVVKRQWSNGLQPCVKLTIKNRTGKLKTVICTPNHRFLLRDGTYKEVQDLSVGESLMPFRRFKSRDYWQVDSQNDGGRQFEHRVVAGAHPGEHIHHVNHQKGDNRPENLKKTTNREHRKFHLGMKYNLSDQTRERYRERAKGLIQYKDKAALARKNSKTWLKAVREHSVPAMLKKRMNHVVVSVEPFGTHEVFDIEIEGSNPNFAIDNCVFVHNSYGGRGATDKEKLRCQCSRPECVAGSPPVLNRSKSDIIAAENRWFAVHAPVGHWQEALLKQVQRDHFYQSPFGVRRWISASWSAEASREVMNIPMQMNAALRMIQAQVELGDAPILFQHHDAFLFEIPESPGSAVDQRIADYQGILERPVPELNGMSFPAKVALGYNWADWSKNNPSGLQET